MQRSWLSSPLNNPGLLGSADTALVSLADGGSVMGSGNVPFAVLGLVAQRREGVHGYQLKREFEALSDDFWQVNYGTLYRVLDLLEHRDELAINEASGPSRRYRKVYRITERGRQSLDDWLLQPASDEARPLRDELALKLLFIGRDRIPKLFKQIRQQRSVYIDRLGGIGRRRKRLEKVGFDTVATGLLLDQAEMRVHTDIAWRDHVERTLLRKLSDGIPRSGEADHRER